MIVTDGRMDRMAIAKTAFAYVTRRAVKIW